ncbi:MAG TPA: 4Fe-4S binding protein [Clostridia bacterium]|nr:4Fe-4S binding protein [Clostridia bacterium]
MKSYYLKTTRVFSPFRKYAWLFILLVAFGGLWYPKLGLLMIPMVIALALFGFFKEKYWCGNICPHGSLFDYLILPISANRKIPAFLKSKPVRYLAFGWFMFMLGSRLLKVLSLYETAPFLDRLGFIFVMNYFVVTMVGTILAFLISPRTWCSFCPMGTFQNIAYRVGRLLGIAQKTNRKVTITDPAKCINCAKCARVCPMQLTPYLEFSQSNQMSNDSCIACASCIENCPVKILAFRRDGNLPANIEGEREKVIAR